MTQLKNFFVISLKVWIATFALGSVFFAIMQSFPSIDLMLMLGAFIRTLIFSFSFLLLPILTAALFYSNKSTLSNNIKLLIITLIAEVSLFIIIKINSATASMHSDQSYNTIIDFIPYYLSLLIFIILFSNKKV